MKRAGHLLQWTLIAMVSAYTGHLHAQAAGRRPKHYTALHALHAEARSRLPMAAARAQLHEKLAA